MANRLKEKMLRGEPVIGHWLSFPSPSVAELMAGVGGMDWLLVDTEHGPTDYETVEDMFRAMRGTDIVPLVRVAGNEPPLIKKVLDRGAYGVIIPLINSVEEAKAAVAACKYPPEGIRGIAGTRINRYGADLPTYFRNWNNDVLVGLQIETVSALENVEKIAAVQGVDMLFIGPNDLSAALGIFQDFENPKFKEAVSRILKAANDNGIAAGYMCGNAKDVLAKVDQGFKFIAAGTEARLLAAAAQATYKEINEGLAARRR